MNATATIDQALTVRCPKCLAAPGDWCVYISPVAAPDRFQSERQRQLSLRVGTPMTTVHAERRRKFEEKERQHQRFRATPVDPELLAAARALKEFDRREYHALVLWLHFYGDVLTEPPSG